jgi:hypothetical protein
MDNLPKSIHLEDNSSFENPDIKLPVKRITIEEAIANGYQKLPPINWVRKESKVSPDFFTVTPDPDNEGWDNVEYYINPKPKDKSAVGWVYVLSNKEHPGMFKIGHTKVSVSGRVKQLNGTSTVGEGWKVEDAFLCLDSYALEQEVHKTLNEYRVRDDREFFQIPLEVAIQTVKDHLRNYTYF